MVPARVIPFTSPGNINSHRGQAVIQISRDEELSRLRAVFLGNTGYAVYSFEPDQASWELRRDRGAKIWLLCHTLQFHEAALLAAEIRGHSPADKLLRLISLHSMTEAFELFDESLEPVGSVDELLRTVAGLARQIAKASVSGGAS
jgi:hypothetical protein